MTTRKDRRLPLSEASSRWRRLHVLSGAGAQGRVMCKSRNGVGCARNAHAVEFLSTLKFKGAQYVHRTAEQGQRRKAQEGHPTFQPRVVSWLLRIALPRTSPPRSLAQAF